MLVSQSTFQRHTFQTKKAEQFYNALAENGVILLCVVLLILLFWFRSQHFFIVLSFKAFGGIDRNSNSQKVTSYADMSSKGDESLRSPLLSQPPASISTTVRTPRHIRVGIQSAFALGVYC